ncbi:MAG: NADH-quinone oxidoreductase subunit NuoH [Saprospiraceae bacterium]|jgi:NADH-quinone oxidoreductase subunit H|nr:NADH-quinone oxidoreductase subunit NuoH [Saprospiraceae bacterium]
MLSTYFIVKIILVLVLFLVTLTMAAYSTYAERKVAAFLQDRLGPNRAGPFGLLQPVADGVKMFMKEEIIPNTSDKAIFILGPSIFMITALLTGVVIPWGPDINVNGTNYPLQIADINIGLLYLFGVVSLGVYGIMLGGWASNNKYSLLGSVRASSQMISYELAMGLSVIGILLYTGSLSIKDIVIQQQGMHWNVFYQPLGFIIFLVCAFAECNRAPFDLAECETELVGGFHTEYSSMKLGLFLFAEYIHMFISSAVIACVFFGGYDFPFIGKLGLSPNIFALVGVVVLFAKIIFFIFFFMWVRWTIPRFRYDQLMKLGWQILIPLGLFNIFVTGGWLTLKNYLNW